MGPVQMPHSPSIFTVGYGNRTIFEFTSLLREWNISFLIDVRSKPYSRFRPEFNRNELNARLDAIGVRYVFMGGSLGGLPDEPTVYVDGKVDYGKVEGLDSYQHGIDRIGTAFAKQLHVVLMCSEGKPELCHRSKLIGQTLSKRGIPIVHLDEVGEPKTQEEVLLRLTGGEPPLFAETLALTSRKVYAKRIQDGEADS